MLNLFKVLFYTYGKKTIIKQRQYKGVFYVSLAGFIDHTNLKADATSADIAKLCLEAADWQFYSVCVNSSHVAAAARLLSGTGVRVCSVVGFPLGASLSGAKACEAKQAAEKGASEIDMVINIGALRECYDSLVTDDISAVVRAVPNCLVKVIIESALLTEEEKKRGCLLAVKAGAHFVKTSTGFSTGGATVSDVGLMRSVVGPHIGVKASGGIRDYSAAVAMINAGASRLGTSASVAICEKDQL